MSGADDHGFVWRAEIDALVFRPAGHDGWCAVHRLAFRALSGPAPTAAGCLDYAVAHRDAFDRAAAAKIARRGLDAGASLHLTSRDIARAL